MLIRYLFMWQPLVTSTSSVCFHRYYTCSGKLAPYALNHNSIKKGYGELSLIWTTQLSPNSVLTAETKVKKERHQAGRETYDGIQLS